MVCEILCVGTEILLGDIVNTNARYLARELAALGIDVYFQTVVGDNEERLLSAYEVAFKRSDMVITSGGLGPTEDDLTKEVATKFFRKKLICDEETLNSIIETFAHQNFEMTDNNKKQALVPDGATVVKNHHGTAPGMILEDNGKTLIMLPGPPSEFIPLFDDGILPYLKQKSDKVLFSRTLRIAGIGESKVEDMIKSLIDKQTNPTVAPYAKTNEVHLRVTACAENIENAKKLLKPTVDKLYKILGTSIYGEDGTSLEEAVVNLLREKQMTLACAESCTGGLLSGRLINVPGISDFLLDGVVSYSNEAKISRLGVNAETLKKYGAVSETVAVEMAKGIAKTSGTTVGISTTGIAGPGGGTDEKPVGLVYIGLFINGEAKAIKLKCVGDREKVRAKAVASALVLLRSELLKLK